MVGSSSANLTVANNIGQKAVYSVKYQHDLWLSWEYPEWGGQSIENLLELIDTQLAANGNDYAAVDISPALGEESSTPDRSWIMMTPVFYMILKVMPERGMF